MRVLSQTRRGRRLPAKLSEYTRLQQTRRQRQPATAAGSGGGQGGRSNSLAQVVSPSAGEPRARPRSGRSERWLAMRRAGRRPCSGPCAAPRGQRRPAESAAEQRASSLRVWLAALGPASAPQLSGSPLSPLPASRGL